MDRTRLIAGLTARRDDARDTLHGFIVKLGTATPLHAFSWSDKAIVAAAKIEVYSSMIELLSGELNDESIIVLCQRAVIELSSKIDTNTSGMMDHVAIRARLAASARVLDALTTGNAMML